MYNHLADGSNISPDLINQLYQENNNLKQEVKELQEQLNSEDMNSPAGWNWWWIGGGIIAVIVIIWLLKMNRRISKSENGRP